MRQQRDLAFTRYCFTSRLFVHESILLLSPPPTCIARTIAILLHVYCAINDAPPIPLLYAIHHTILALAISCEGQGGTDHVMNTATRGARRVSRRGGTLSRATSMLAYRKWHLVGVVSYCVWGGFLWGPFLCCVATGRNSSRATSMLAYGKWHLVGFESACTT